MQIRQDKPLFMKIRIATILVICTLFVGGADAQHDSPLTLAKKIFAKDSLPNIAEFVTGEYQGRPNGQDLRDGAVTKFLLLKQTEKDAVVAMTILDSSGKGLDTYLFFVKDRIWKMNAFRSLATTGIIEQVKDQLEKMTLKQVDEMVEESRKNKKKSMFESREDYQFQLGNAKLTLELDENIIRHFHQNKTEFERLKNLAVAQLDKRETDEENRAPLLQNERSGYQKLFISSVSSGGYELGKSINFFIGGILDNSVGYIWVKDKKDLPEMNSNTVIMLREIGGGWYIYKTT